MKKKLTLKINKSAAQKILKQIPTGSSITLKVSDAEKILGKSPK